VARRPLAQKLKLDLGVLLADLAAADALERDALSRPFVFSGVKRHSFATLVPGKLPRREAAAEPAMPRGRGRAAELLLAKRPSTKPPAGPPAEPAPPPGQRSAAELLLAKKPSKIKN